MNKELVKHIAKLSSFELTELQLEQYTKDLSNICKILDAVKKVNTDGTKPMVTPLTTNFKFREDVSSEQNNTNIFKTFACEVENDYFIVPQVIK